MLLQILFSNYLDNEVNELMARCIASSQEFFTRYQLQVLLVLVLWQLYVPPQKIIKAFHQMITAGSKFKFKVITLMIILTLCIALVLRHWI
jgi:hypothetical protein